MTKIVIGVDPSLTKTGVGIIKVSSANEISFVAARTIYTSSKDPIAKRLLELHDNLNQIIGEFRPDVAAIEEVFVNKNPLSSLKLGHGRGALILSLAINNLPVYEYSATKIKKSVTGVGRADKNQIMQMMKYLIPKADFKTEDEADALAVAVCYVNNCGGIPTSVGRR